MKIVTWNCNGAFRDYFKEITDKKSDTYVDADIYVIQECENPRDYRSDYEEYRKIVRDLAGNNYYWVGDSHSKGLGIFAKESVKLRRKKVNGDYKHFMAFRVNDEFDLLCIWAMDPYVEMIHDFFDDNPDLFNEDLILCGDFNSNAKWDKDHNTRDENGDKKNHSNLNRKLNEKGLYSVYHCVTGEKPIDKSKVETKNTFFLYRHLNKPDHIDYFYAKKDLIDKTKWRGERYGSKANLPYEFEILERWQWLSMSDHLPLVWNIREKLNFKNEYYLHKFTQENLKELFRLKFVASERQHKISKEEYDELKLGDIGFDEDGKELTIRVDNIAFDEKTNELVIIEYKNELEPKVLKQVEKYKEVVNAHPDVFNERKYDEFGIKEEESIHYPFEKIRVMIIAPEFDSNIKKEYPSNVELWEVSLWDKLNNGEGEVVYKKLEKGSKKGITKKLDIDLENLKLSEKDVIERNVPEDKREEICALYCSFREKVFNKCDVLIPISNGVSFRVNNEIACLVYFNKNNIKLHFKADELVCPINESNTCKLDCPKNKTNSELGCLRELTDSYVGNYELILEKNEDIDFAFELFKQVYNEKWRNRK